MERDDYIDIAAFLREKKKAKIETRIRPTRGTKKYWKEQESDTGKVEKREENRKQESGSD